MWQCMLLLLCSEPFWAQLSDMFYIFWHVISFPLWVNTDKTEQQSLNSCTGMKSHLPCSFPRIFGCCNPQHQITPLNSVHALLKLSGMSQIFIFQFVILFRLHSGSQPVLVCLLYVYLLFVREWFVLTPGRISDAVAEANVDQNKQKTISNVGPLNSWLVRQIGKHTVRVSSSCLTAMKRPDYDFACCSHVCMGFPSHPSQVKW